MRDWKGRLAGVLGLLVLVIVVAWAVWLVSGQASPEPQRGRASDGQQASAASGASNPDEGKSPETIYFIQEDNGEAVILRADFNETTIELDNLQTVARTGLAIDLVGKTWLSPNQQFLAMEIRHEVGGLGVWNLVSGKRVDVQLNGKFPYNLRFLAWSADGKYILAQVGLGGGVEPGFWRINILADEDHHLFEGIAPYGGMISADVSPNNDKILYSFSLGLAQGSELWEMNWVGEDRRLLLAKELHNIAGTRYSPDGKQISYIELPDGATPFTLAQLWVMNNDGSQQVLLSEKADGGHGYVPVWSSDNRKIAFVTRENPTDPIARQVSDAASNNIYLADTVTAESSPLVSQSGQRNYSPTWSPDGQSVIFVSDRTGTDNLWYVRSDGTGLKPVGEPQERSLNPLWSLGLQAIFFPIVFKQGLEQMGGDRG